LNAINEINSLPKEQVEKAKQRFYEGGGPTGYTGMIAKADNSGVWVWGVKGIKHFKSDENTVYILWSVCNPSVMAKIEKGESFSPLQNATLDIATWTPRERVGQFVDIKLATKLNGGIEGNVREVRAYDWWVFTAVDMGAQCKN